MLDYHTRHAPIGPLAECEARFSRKLQLMAGRALHRVATNPGLPGLGCIASPGIRKPTACNLGFVHDINGV